MDDDYWNTSSVRKKVSQQSIFDTDESNAMDVSCLSCDANASASSRV